MVCVMAGKRVGPLFLVAWAKAHATVERVRTGEAGDKTFIGVAYGSVPWKMRADFTDWNCEAYLSFARYSVVQESRPSTSLRNYCMLLRLLLAVVICLVSQRSVSAEPTVFFRGKQITYRHFVYGEVSSSAGRSGTINLGYAHGMKPGQDVGVLRRSEGRLVPIGVLRLVEVRPGDAYGKFDSSFSLKREDLIIVSARELDLWRGRSRSDQLVIQSLLSRNGKGYDTGDVTPALLNEVGRDDDLIIYRPPVLHVNAEAYSMLNPAVRNTVIRGAFRPASRSEDGTLSPLSYEDQQLSPDAPTLDLETAFSRFVLSNGAGETDLNIKQLRMLASELPGLVDPEEVRVDLDRSNAQIRNLLQPK